MGKVYLIYLIIFICFTSCKRQLEDSNEVSELKVSQDSILKIVDKLCGEWEVEERIKKSYESRGIGTGQMDIMCLVNIDNDQLLNEFYVDNSSGLSDLDAIIPPSIDSLFLPEGDSVTISKRKKYYGFKYHNLKTKNFIPIKELNDSLLTLLDGRKFQRKK